MFVKVEAINCQSLKYLFWLNQFIYIVLAHGYSVLLDAACLFMIMNNLTAVKNQFA